MIEALIAIGIYLATVLLSMLLNKYLYKKYNDINVLPWAWFIPMVNFLVLIALLIMAIAHDASFFKATYWEDKWDKND